MINDVLEKTGEGQKYSKILFSKSDSPYLIDEPFEIVNSGTEWVMEDGAFLQLVANADQNFSKLIYLIDESWSCTRVIDQLRKSEYILRI